MTLKTLKPKASTSLILDEEFLQYCKLNNIEDIEKLARETFNQGFTILKYGKTPPGVKKEVKKEESPPVIAVPSVKPVITSEKKIEKNDLYDE